MVTDAPSESNSDALDAENAVAFPTRGAGETFICALRDHPGFCYWCLCPLQVNPVIQFDSEGPKDTLRTGETFQEYAHPVEDVPPDRTDETGQIVEASRDEKTICGSCGVIDIDASESRTKKTTLIALRYVCSILSENGVDVDLRVADNTVTEAFRKGRTGQFVRTLGGAVYKATG